MPGIKSVPDTNVVIARHKSIHFQSPNVEFFTRWRKGEFVVCYSHDTLLEDASKLRAMGIGRPKIVNFLRIFAKLGEVVPISTYLLKVYPVDTDDIAFVLCAVNGSATHLVSYDTHFLDLDGEYPFQICRTVEFLGILNKNLGA